MAIVPKTKPKSRTPQRETSRRKSLRAQEARATKFQVPDLRDPKVSTEIRRQAKLMTQHPENDAIDDWLDAIRDPSDWL